MKKIERQLIELKAGDPYRIFPTGGIDFYAEFNFRYPASAWDKQITISLKTAGQSVSKDITLEEGGSMLFQFEDLNGSFEGHSDGHFGYVELFSQDDLSLELTADEPELAS